MRLSTKEALLGLSVVSLATVLTTVLPGALCLRLLAGHERETSPQEARTAAPVPAQTPAEIPVPAEPPAAAPNVEDTSTQVQITPAPRQTEAPRPLPVPEEPRVIPLTLAAYVIQKPAEPTLVRVRCQFNPRHDSPSHYCIKLLPYDMHEPWAYEFGWVQKNSEQGRFLWESLKNGQDRKTELILAPFYQPGPVRTTTLRGSVKRMTESAAAGDGRGSSNGCEIIEIVR